MARSSHHVVHNPNGGWDVKRGGAQRSSGHYSTKQEAVNAGTNQPQSGYRVRNSWHEWTDSVLRQSWWRSLSAKRISRGGEKYGCTSWWQGR